jgi:predicted nucleic acid-binding protein
MCIIIDANVANEFAVNSEDSKPILSLLIKKKLRLVCDGNLKLEWQKTRLSRLYRELLLAGSLREYSDSEILMEKFKIDERVARSNDLHVLRLAKCSGARILFSKDVKLHSDFKNTKLIPTPKGKVYQGTQHSHVLTEELCDCH